MTVKRLLTEIMLALFVVPEAAVANPSDHVQEIAGSDLLVAVGRIPNTADIGLQRAGVELDARGYIRVNERLATTASGVWAIGECAGSPQFTHVSVDDFRIVKENMVGGNRSTRGRLMPARSAP